MRYTFSCDFYFNVEANNYEEAVAKGWDFIYSNLPECFNTEGAELWCEEKEGEEDEG